MKEKTEKCLEDCRRGAEEVVCWRPMARIEKEKKSLGNFCKKAKTKKKLRLGRKTG